MRIATITALLCAIVVLGGTRIEAQPTRADQSLSGSSVIQIERYTATESWQKSDVTLTYTFNPDGSFVSSDADGGKGKGVWAREGLAVVMVWPAYQAFYVGTLDNDEVRGSAYFNTGELMGTFVLRREP